MLNRRLFASCVICAAIGLVADNAPAQTPSGIKRTITGRRDGPVDGYETLEVLVDIDPHFLVPWHTHPGTEAGYCIEGSSELRVQGAALQANSAGSTWIIAAETPHTVQNGAQPTKQAVTYVVQKGKPLATLVPAPS